MTAQVLAMEQGSDDWVQARLGKVTASRMADVIARTKSGYGMSRKNYMSELMVERLTGIPIERYVSPAMQWGIDWEPKARAAYELTRDQVVRQVGFVIHHEFKSSGASPDGFVGRKGLVEIKCPNTWTHVETTLTGAIPDRYIVQCQWRLAVTSRSWVDYVSFDPRLPADAQLYVQRIERDDDRIAELETEVQSFLAELDQLLKQFEEKVSAA